MYSSKSFCRIENHRNLARFCKENPDSLPDILFQVDSLFDELKLLTGCKGSVTRTISLPISFNSEGGWVGSSKRTPTHYQILYYRGQLI
jgi:hypothetical protein